MKLVIDQSEIFIANGGKLVNPDLPTLVFIHSAGMDHTVWTVPKRYFLRKNYNVLAIDLPGHGSSTGKPLDTIEAMSSCLGAILKDLSIEQIRLAGHSMGALVCLDFALRNPRQVSQMALLGVALPMRVSEKLLLAAEQNDPSAYDMISLWSHTKQAQLSGNQNPGMWLNSTRRLLERNKPGTLFSGLSACNNYQISSAELANILCPTSIICGQADVMTPAKSGRGLAEKLATCRLLELANCGHAMLSEQPNRILAALETALTNSAQD